MQRGKRNCSKELTTLILKLAVLGVIALIFVPAFRNSALAIVVVIVGSGIGLGLLFFQSSSQHGVQQNAFGRRLNLCHGQIQAPAVSAKSNSSFPDNLVARLRSIDWFQFEKVVAAMYTNLGYSVIRRGGANPDGGIDLILENGTGRMAVQCKQWKTWKVREPVVREFLGAITHAKISGGFIVTLCGHTSEAQRLAEAHNIKILDEIALVKMLTETSAATDPKILSALNDDRKICPKCESQMRLKRTWKGKRPGSKFWGCSAYPRCRYTMSFQNHEEVLENIHGRRVDVSFS